MVEHSLKARNDRTFPQRGNMNGSTFIREVESISSHPTDSHHWQIHQKAVE